MSDAIRKEFIEGINEVFIQLFNDGVNEGVNLYLLSDTGTTNVYNEQKYKTFKKPIMLPCKAQLTPNFGEQDVEQIKDKASFTIPLKALLDHNFDVSNSGLNLLRKCMLEFHGTYYTVDNILPKAYVRDVFLLYSFECTEDKNRTSITLEKEV